ncbi:phytanoyl-CoA hydroxylase [Microdochium nivale]|nr:phytanoyl-CoA hydroxylase [Microdochium nivale]
MMASLVPKPSGPAKTFNNLNAKFGDFRDDLTRDGYAVVKGAIPRERADQYANRMFEYLENFKGGLGFKRDDRSTYVEKNMPIINEKGLCFAYGITHEDFAWDIRAEPGVVGAFEKVFDTEDLIVSFDGFNFTFPTRTDMKENTPWPHQDQDPEKSDFRCLQGLVNMLPNGANDGGLLVCKGGHLLSGEFHREFKDEKEKVWAWTKEWYGFTDAGMKWLKDRGCEWIKVEADPGDLIIWDSRTPHYNQAPTSENPRFCAYTCYMPAADATQEDLLRKKYAYENTLRTTHWPNASHVGGLVTMRDGKPDPYDDDKPAKPAKLSERAFKLTGIPYVATSA